MTRKELKAAFRAHKGEYLKFERIAKPMHRRPDVCAFLMLDAAVDAPAGDIVTGTNHEVIYLNIEIDDLAAVATDEMVCDLVRCGVRIDEDVDSLAMFV